MISLAFIACIAILFLVVVSVEGANDEERDLLKPHGLIRWLTGGNWTAKVGAVLFLIGSGALIRYLMLNIDVPPGLKLGVGVVITAGLAVASSMLHGKPARRAIHLALGGAALGVAYLTAYSAYGFFHFVASIDALALLFIVACAGTAFALSADALSIAILAMAGAFLAPAFALESPGVLPVYGYYLAVSVIVLIMLSLRNWHPLMHLSFLFTLAGALFFGWTGRFYSPQFFPQMHPLLLALVGVHLLMPIVEHVQHDERASWLRRFDKGYFLLLPVVSAILMLLVAPDDAVDGAIGLFELGGLWCLVGAVQYYRRRRTAGAYFAVAVVFAAVAALFAFKDLPYLLIAATLSCFLAGAARLLGLSRESGRLLSMAALMFSACYVLQSLLDPSSGDALWGRGFFCDVVLSVALGAAAYGLRIKGEKTLAPVFAFSSIAWIIISFARQLVLLKLEYLPQFAYVMALVAAFAYAASLLRRPPSTGIALLLGVVVLISSVFCVPTLSQGWLLLAMLGGQLSFFMMAHFSIGHGDASEKAFSGIVRSMLPPLVLPAAIGLARYSGYAGASEVMTFFVLSALLASLHAQIFEPEDHFWPNALSPAGFVIAAFWLFYQTLFHIDRNAWAVGYELLATLYLAQTVFALKRAKSADLAFFAFVSLLAALSTVAAMFLRGFGPPGVLTIFALNSMLLPAVVSLLIAALGAVLAVCGNQRKLRLLWGVGAAFLILAAIKLVFYDFGSLGQLGNIIAMMGAGAVFMGVAWLAPFPPVEEKMGKADVASDSRVSHPPLARPEAATAQRVSPPLSVSASASLDTSESAMLEPEPDAAPARRPWIWILLVIGIVLFIHHRGERIPVPSAPQSPPPSSAPLSLAELPLPTLDSSEGSAFPRSGLVSTDCQAFIKRLPENYDILVAGGGDASRGLSHDIPAGIDVDINKPNRNILLVLGTKDFVEWRVRPALSTRLVGVILSGERASNLVGQGPDLPVLLSSMQSGASCGYFSADKNNSEQAHSFVSALLTRAIDEFAVPEDGRVSFGAFYGKVSPAATTFAAESSASSSQHVKVGNGIQCFVPAWNSPATSCSGRVIASGSMNNSDSPLYAARSCASSGVAGSCCMYHLYGEGQWYLTDGAPQSQGRLCAVEASGGLLRCESGGICSSR